jgi:hypothetical protein
MMMVMMLRGEPGSRALHLTSPTLQCSVLVVVIASVLDVISVRDAVLCIAVLHATRWRAELLVLTREVDVHAVRCA